MAAGKGLFGGYCYGPADLVSVKKGDSTMWLKLRDSTGRTVRATYYGCVYWRLEKSQEGMHIPLVVRMTVDELMSWPDSVTLLALRKNSSHVESLLREWEAEGLHFYLHYGSERDSEYLVVARYLEYHEKS